MSHISLAFISKSKRCLNVKSSTYYYHMKTKILADFQIYMRVPLKDKTNPKMFDSNCLWQLKWCKTQSLLQYVLSLKLCIFILSFHLFIYISHLIYIQSQFHLCSVWSYIYRASVSCILSLILIYSVSSYLYSVTLYKCQKQSLRGVL